MSTTAFLAERQLRSVSLPSGTTVFESVGLALGQGASALEVLVVRTSGRPQLPNVRTLWKKRNDRRAAPLLVVVLHDAQATVCGPTGDDPPAYPDAEAGQVERICREALDLPDRHAVLRYLRDALEAIKPDAALPGIRNEGFLATHELARGARQMAQWGPARNKAAPLLAAGGQQLLNRLGFNSEPCDQMTSILRAGTAGRKLALAVLLHAQESPDLNADRFAGLSPVSYAMTVAERENLRYVIVVQDRKLRLYPVQSGVGVGQRGRNETFVQVDTRLLRDDDAAYLWLLFSAEALAPDGTLDQLIADSHRFAGELADRLRYLNRTWSEQPIKCRRSAGMLLRHMLTPHGPRGSYDHMPTFGHWCSAVAGSVSTSESWPHAELCAHGEHGRESKEDPKEAPAARRAKGEWLAAALLHLKEEPNTSDAELARAVGVHRSTIGRNPTIKQARQNLQDRHRVPKGQKSDEKGIEAWEDE